jgi:site-specific recombinase XerC
LARTGRIELVRDFLRHASIATTQVYAESDPGALAAAIAEW